MRIGHSAWAVSWISLSIVLAILASTFGPGPVADSGAPVVMVRIPGGSFKMGIETESFDEQPAHMLALRAFEIDRVPVDNARFAEFLNATGVSHPAHGLLYQLTDPAARIVWERGRYVVMSGYEQHPVVAETWQGARAYCIWRGARLPTEAEWERTARGQGGRLYPWGDDPPDASLARYDRLLLDYLPVGSYPAGATPEGVQDMAGNVWQWTSSLFRPYPYRADDGREDPNAEGARVIRGGSHHVSAEMLRSSYRGTGATVQPVGAARLPPSARPPTTFRCARDAG